MLTIEEINRYSRQLMQQEIGLEGQLKLKAAKVMVIGAGGLGCPVLQYLAGAGLGTISIVDFDTIEIHNLHRQILYTPADVGKKKPIIAAEKLNQLNPHCHINSYDVLLNEENVETLIADHDLVIDGSDNFNTRYIVNDACVRMGKPLVYGSILNFEGQIAVFNYKGSKNLRDLYPQAPDPEDVPSCSENGVLGIVPGVIGTMMCGIGLNIILEKNVNINSLLLCDLNSYSLRSISY